MSAQILKLMLLPGVNPADFERTLKETIFPRVQIEDRSVAATYHRVFRSNVAGPDSSSYTWLVFTKLVGPTPDTAGEGPVVLCELPLPVAQIANYVAKFATVTPVDEI
jgi:hypothetical protein